MKQSVRFVLTLVLCFALSISGVVVCIPTTRAAETGTWTAVNTGLTDYEVKALAINPLTPTTLYAGMYGGGLFRSTDSGTTWSAVNAGLTGGYILSVAINPVTPSTLYAGTGNLHGVFRSTDSGTRWTAVNTGLTALSIESIVINPLTPSTLYAATWVGGVFRSLDSGDHWTAMSTGLTKMNICSLSIDPLTPSTLYAGTDAGGVFRSMDSGSTWMAINTGLANAIDSGLAHGGGEVCSLAINPLTPTTVYASILAGGVFRSMDSGDHWIPVNTGLPSLSTNSIAIDPLTPTTLYASGWGVFRSMDSGDHWIAMSTGLTKMNVWALAINPLTPSILYAGTYGGGVFRGVFTIQRSVATPTPPAGWALATTFQKVPLTLDSATYYAWELQKKGALMAGGWLITKADGTIVSDQETYKKLALTATVSKMVQDSSFLPLMKSELDVLNGITWRIDLYEMTTWLMKLDADIASWLVAGNPTAVGSIKDLVASALVASLMKQTTVHAAVWKLFTNKVTADIIPPLAKDLELIGGVSSSSIDVFGMVGTVVRNTVATFAKEGVKSYTAAFKIANQQGRSSWSYKEAGLFLQEYEEGKTQGLPFAKWYIKLIPHEGGFFGGISNVSDMWWENILKELAPPEAKSLMTAVDARKASLDFVDKVLKNKSFTSEISADIYSGDVIFATYSLYYDPVIPGSLANQIVTAIAAQDASKQGKQ
jgi:photosystem II stability/assembly factor-like uncharacterized protein